MRTIGASVQGFVARWVAWPWAREQKIAPRSFERSQLVVGTLFASLFVASAVHLGHFLLVPIENWGGVVARNFLAHFPPAQSPRQDFAVVRIDSNRFHSREQNKGYKGKSPLDRCQLLRDLELISSIPTLKTLAIDLDLSPTQEPEQDECGQELIDFLSRLTSSRQATVLALLPIDPGEREQPQAKAWMNGAKAAGIHLVSANLNVEYGLVRQHDLSSGDQNLGQALGLAISADATDGKTHQPHGWRQIAFHKMVRVESDFGPHKLKTLKGVPSATTEPTLENHIAWLVTLKPPIRHLIFGANYGQDDVFQTPIGPLYGVDIHAAIALEPAEPHSAWVDVFFDIMLGVFFGLLVHKFWRKYFDQRLAHGPDEVHRFGPPEHAYRWLLCLTVLWLLLALLILPTLSLYALGSWGWWINPVPMLVGMTIDAFVVGSVHTVLHKLHGETQEHGGATSHGAPLPVPRRWGALQTALANGPSLLWMGVVGAAVYQITAHS